MEEETERAFPACSRDATAWIPCSCKVRANEGRKEQVEEPLLFQKTSVQSQHLLLQSIKGECVELIYVLGF